MRISNFNRPLCFKGPNDNKAQLLRTASGVEQQPFNVITLGGQKNETKPIKAHSVFINDDAKVKDVYAEDLISLSNRARANNIYSGRAVYLKGNVEVNNITFNSKEESNPTLTIEQDKLNCPRVKGEINFLYAKGSVEVLSKGGSKVELNPRKIYNATYKYKTDEDMFKKNENTGEDNNFLRKCLSSDDSEDYTWQCPTVTVDCPPPKK